MTLNILTIGKFKLPVRGHLFIIVLKVLVDPLLQQNHLFSVVVGQTWPVLGEAIPSKIFLLTDKRC